MSKYRVVVVEKIFKTFEREKKVLSDVNATLEVYDCKTRDEALQVLKDTDGVLLHHIFQMDAEVLNTMKKCRIVSRYGIGYDNVDVEAATKAGIWVARVPEYGAEEDVADQALALLMACIREVCFKNRKIREGEWNLHSQRKSYRIKGKVLGIIGYGNIGRSLHRKVSGFGLSEILVNDPFIPQEDIVNLGCVPVDKETLIKESDYISIHTPLSKQANNLIGSKEFSMMKKTAIIINSSRGGIINEESLYKALKNNRIKAAGLDVFKSEPLAKDNKLLTLDNLIVSDHCGYYSEESLDELKSKAALNIAQVLKGNRPVYPVNDPTGIDQDDSQQERIL